MQLMRGSQANLPGEMTTRWGPGGSQETQKCGCLGERNRNAFI